MPRRPPRGLLLTRLRYERQHRKHSQKYLALAAGLNQPDLSMIERGILIPSPQQLERLAAVYDVAPGDLLKEVVIVPQVLPA